MTLIEILRSARRLAVATHVKPDGDAVGSASGFTRICRDRGIAVELLLPEPLPERNAAFAASFRTSISPAELASCDALVLLDSARPERAAAGPGIEIAKLPVPLLNIDHHEDNSVVGIATASRVRQAPATAGMVAELADELGWPIGPEAATALLMGLITDTGCFRFSNTSPEAFRCAARLLEAGADHERIINAIYFSKPRSQQEFESELLSRYLRTACGGRYVYAVAPPELFEKYGFSMRDGEGVIDLIREVRGALIAGLFYRRDGAVKVSLRAKDSRFPAAPVLRKFGGGGHPMAAGATLTGMSLDEAAKKVEEEVKRMFDEGNEA